MKRLFSILAVFLLLFSMMAFAQEVSNTKIGFGMRIGFFFDDLKIRFARDKEAVKTVVFEKRKAELETALQAKDAVKSELLAEHLNKIKENKAVDFNEKFPLDLSKLQTKINLNYDNLLGRVGDGNYLIKLIHPGDDDYYKVVINKGKIVSITKDVASSVVDYQVSHARLFNFQQEKMTQADVDRLKQDIFSLN